MRMTAVEKSNILSVKVLQDREAYEEAAIELKVAENGEGE